MGGSLVLIVAWFANVVAFGFRDEVSELLRSILCSFEANLPGLFVVVLTGQGLIAIVRLVRAPGSPPPKTQAESGWFRKIVACGLIVYGLVMAGFAIALLGAARDFCGKVFTIAEHAVGAGGAFSAQLILRFVLSYLALLTVLIARRLLRREPIRFAVWTWTGIHCAPLIWVIWGALGP